MLEFVDHFTQFYIFYVNARCFQEEKDGCNSLDLLKEFDIIDRINNKLLARCSERVSCADVFTIGARGATLLVHEHEKKKQTFSINLLI